MTYDPDNLKHIERNKRYQHEWYLKNKDTQIARNKNRYRKVVLWLREYKSTLACSICSENHPATLCFHHPNSDASDKSIGALVQRGWSISSIQKEIDKCQVLCHNCHNKLHYEQRTGAYRYL